MRRAASMIPDFVGIEPQARLADRLADGRDDLNIELVAAADLDVEDLEARIDEFLGMGCQLIGRVALDEAEILDLVAHRAAEQLVQRQVRRLADGVPQRQLDAGQGLREIARRTAGAAGVEAVLVVVPDDPIAIIDRLADESGDRVLQDRQYRGDDRARRRLADADDALVGFDLDQDDRRTVGDALRPVIGLLERAKQRRQS